MTDIKLVKRKDDGFMNKIVSLDDVNAERLNAFCKKYGWSATRASQFVLAYNNVSTQLKSMRRNESDLVRKNIFIPMTPHQNKAAVTAARKDGLSFSSFFKVNLKHVYEELQTDQLDFDKNEMTQKFKHKK
ncbi:MAG TPA: hypothetical protein VM577_08630 [Anaerovoracaceae bacterium]|nr:hypothetical protein [Anaerovoracaceae bacterium]